MNNDDKKKETKKLQRELNRYIRGDSTFNYFIQQCMQIEEFYRE